MSWSAQKKKKRGFFVPFILCQGNFFKICVLSQRTQAAITFQKLAIETLEQGVKYVQS